MPLLRKVDKDGKVPIPTSIRDMLDLRVGDEVEIVANATNDHVVLLRKHGPRSDQAGRLDG